MRIDYRISYKFYPLFIDSDPFFYIFTAFSGAVVSRERASSKATGISAHCAGRILNGGVQLWAHWASKLQLKLRDFDKGRSGRSDI